MSMSAEPVNTKVIGLLYEYFTFWYCGLYKWVECGAENACSQTELKRKIDAIVALCQENMRHIDTILPGCDYSGKIENVIEKKHIRYPFIYFNLPWGDTAIRMKIRIRINPCVYLGPDNSVNGKHSKVWSIFQSLDQVSFSSNELVDLYSKLDSIAAMIESFVASSYVNIIDNEDERGQVAIIKIRSASLDPSKQIGPFADDFLVAGNATKDDTKTETNETIDFGKLLSDDPDTYNATKDVFLFSKFDLAERILDNDILSSRIAEDIVTIGQNHVWRVGEEQNCEVMYRLYADEEKITVGGIVRATSEDSRHLDLYHTFQRLALNFSWLI